jgi:hypothetical protein
MLRPVVLERTDVSEQLIASFIRVTRINELGTTLAATSNRRTLRESRILDFISFKPAPQSTQPPFQGVPGALSAGGTKLQGLDADNSLQLRAEV